MEAVIRINGLVLVLLALLHVGFPRYFNWKKDLQQLSLVNKEMMQVHTFFIALIVLLIGLLCVYEASALLNTRLGKSLSLGLAVFWGVRLFFQFFVYSPQLWRGKRFETVMHIVFSIFWFNLTAIFVLAFLW